MLERLCLFAPSRPDNTKCTRMRIFRLRTLLFVIFLYEGFSKTFSAGPYAGQVMGQRETTPSGDTRSLSLMAANRCCKRRQAGF